MRKLNLRRTKRGAASFYIVAFSTLILTVIATSFAMVIISEISRSANDDLSQSAYDSALAGVEDAKLAFANYQRCVESGATKSLNQPSGIGGVTCGDIIWWMENPDCYMVGHILGKIGKDETTEVFVGEQIKTDGTKENILNQAYTCVQINTKLTDYRATIGSTNNRQTTRLQVGNGATNNVTKLKLSWYTVRADVIAHYNNIASGKAVFPALNTIGGSQGKSASNPPVVELQLLQTAASFQLSDFDEVEGNSTDRATLYLVPTNNASLGKTSISAGEVAKTNNREVSNQPFIIACNGNDEFYCSVEIELPGVIRGGARSNDTFMVSISLPYQQPDTDFSIQLFCGGSDTACGTSDGAFSGGDRDNGSAVIRNTQIAVDSTGRANDLYRRVETRLESADTMFGSGYPYYALEVLGNSGFSKNLTVKREDSQFYF